MTIWQEESGNVFSVAVIDHAANPRNAGSMDDADAYASVLGPCGDNMEMWLEARNGMVKNVTFWTDGCSATIACGSMATELAKGKTLGEALAISADVIAISLGGLTGKVEQEAIMEIRLTTLSENTAGMGDFLAEWGLSILVEVDGMRILMDTGLSSSAVHNARVMGIDLSTIDRIVLSHGHTDHTGGLRDVLKIKGKVEVIAHPDVWASKYTRRNGQEEEQYIGIPFSREELESRGARFNLSKKPVRISEHVMTTGEIPMLSEYEAVENNLFVKRDGALRQDPLADDLALVIDAEFGLVVITGCAHRGIVNTLRLAQGITGREQVYAAIGGTHLLRVSEERIEKTIADLKRMGIQRLGVSHCTGFHASACLAQEFEGIFFLNNAGTQLTLP